MWVQAMEKVPTAKVVHLPVRDNQIIQINRRPACRPRAVHRAKTRATTATPARAAAVVKAATTATAARVIRMTVETVITTVTARAKNRSKGSPFHLSAGVLI